MEWVPSKGERGREGERVREREEREERERRERERERERESRPEKIYMRTIGAHAKIRYFK